MVSRAKGTIPPSLTIGSGQAETDHLLEDAFVETADYKAVTSREDARCIVVARTGAGKTALLQHLELQHPGHVIRVTPEDLSLPYITERDVFRTLEQLEVNVNPLFVALWKHILVVEIIRHRYNVNSELAKNNVMDRLKERLRRDTTKAAALQYLEEFEDKFWLDADERVREITERLERDMLAETGLSLGSGPVAVGYKNGESVRHTAEERRELSARFQRFINETQLPKLNRMMRVLDDEVLDSPQNFTYIIVDDLDRDWVDDRLTNDLVACLFRTVLDLQRVSNLKVIVALRENLLERMRASGTSVIGQEEKLRDLTLRLSWTRQSLGDLLRLRTVKALERDTTTTLSQLSEMLPREHKKLGSPMDFIIDRTLMRPRDAISYINFALPHAAEAQRMSWGHLSDAEYEYSKNRLLALRDEWAPNYPGIADVFEAFRGGSSVMAREELAARLETAVLDCFNRYDFRGSVWLTRLTEALWVGTGDWVDQYGELLRLLFQVGLIGIGRRGDVRFVAERPDWVTRNLLESEFTACVHPAFQSALEIR